MGPEQIRLPVVTVPVGHELTGRKQMKHFHYCKRKKRGVRGLYSDFIEHQRVA
jgi:hypothetical protein